MTIMHRTTIVIPEELLWQLRRIAADQGRSMAAVMREALEEKVRSYHPRPRSLGSGASGVADTARRAGEERPAARPWG
jgi:predicted transcriptional regulator